MNTAHWTTSRLLSTTARLNEHHQNQRRTEIGVTHAGAITLKALSDSGPISQAGLASLIHVQAQTMGKVLEKLRITGLVARARDTSDGRTVRTHVTSEGDAALRCIGQITDASAKSLGPPDQKLRRSLMTIITTLEQHQPEPRRLSTGRS